MISPFWGELLIHIRTSGWTSVPTGVEEVGELLGQRWREGEGVRIRKRVWKTKQLVVTAAFAWVWELKRSHPRIHATGVQFVHRDLGIEGRLYSWFDWNLREIVELCLQLPKWGGCVAMIMFSCMIWPLCASNHQGPDVYNAHGVRKSDKRRWAEVQHKSMKMRPSVKLPQANGRCEAEQRNKRGLGRESGSHEHDGRM